MASRRSNRYRYLAETIDKFEDEMLQTIRDVANDVREKLDLFIDKQMNDVILHYDELDLICDKDEYWELDVNILRNSTEQIRYELNETDNTQNRKMDTYVHPIHQKDVVKIYIEDCQQQREDAYEDATMILDNYSEMKLTHHEPRMTINIQSRFYSRIATSDNYLLHCSKDKLYAININDVDQLQPIAWDKDDWVIDICYSTILKRFLIWSNSGFYTFDSTTMMKQTIENIPDTGTGWYYCACFNDFLFLSYDDSVEQRKIEMEANEYVLINQWKLAVEGANEVIVGMEVNELRIVLSIGEYGRSKRFELRDYTMNILYTLHMDICNITLSRNSKWLVITKLPNQLMIINNDGRIEEKAQHYCKDSLLDAIIFGTNILVFVTDNQLHFHCI